MDCINCEKKFELTDTFRPIMLCNDCIFECINDDSFKKLPVEMYYENLTTIQKKDKLGPFLRERIYNKIINTEIDEEYYIKLRIDTHDLLARINNGDKSAEPEYNIKYSEYKKVMYDKCKNKTDLLKDLHVKYYLGSKNKALCVNEYFTFMIAQLRKINYARLGEKVKEIYR